MKLSNINIIHTLYNYIISSLRIKKYIVYSLLFLVFGISDLCSQNVDREYKVYYYDNGKISSEGYMVDGNPDGYWITYYPSGQVKSEGNRKNLQLDSTWVFYSEEGEMVSKITYMDGIKEGPLTTFKDGVVYEVANFEKDKREGFSVLYYPTGEVWKRIPYSAGKESGEGFEYARDGRVITLLEYEDGYLKRAEKINRKDDRGKKRGPWIEFHPNGVIAMEGTYMNDLRNGIFKTYDKEGNLLTLEKYRNGELVIDSEEAVILDLRNTYYSDGKVKSSGGYVDGKKEGTHRFYDKEGNVISTTVYSRGDKTAEGIVDVKGDFQGEWKLYYDTGELKAEGFYENSQRTGEWVFYHKNGEIEHRGKYLAGLPQGKWTWYFENGKLRREEYYRRGEEDGMSVEYDIEGNIITQGEYVSGYKEGEWFYHVGDHTEKGSYRDGERTGEWIYEYPDGDLNFKGEYVAGLAVGKHEWYYPNGQLKKEGKYSSGVRVGTWKTYNEEGIEILNVKYKNGQEFKINGKKVLDNSELTEEEI